MWWRPPERAADSGLRAAYRLPAPEGGSPPAAGGPKGGDASGAASSGRPVAGRCKCRQGVRQHAPTAPRSLLGDASR